MMATWTPGSYLVREYARHIDSITAANSEGEPLDIEKTSKNRWTIKTPDHENDFTVTYRLYCNELSVRTNMVERSYAVLNGAATFLTIPQRLDVEHRIELNMPNKWKRSSSSLPPLEGKADQYRAASYDELVDSPVVAGNVELFPFFVDGVKHVLVNVNDRGDWDGSRAADELAKVVAAHHRLWNCVPYDRYYFINVIAGGGGGLEHDNSCLLLTNRYAMRSEGSFRNWLGLASHEFFHAWNVRRLRPRSLVKYDYETEIYTPSLWVAEGVTTYYEDLLLVRAGLMEPAEFVSGMGGKIRSLQSSDGRKLQSLRDASFDAWIKFYRPSPNSDDTQISYYTKGAVVAMLLDARIRAASNGSKSLDDALRLLYERHAGTVGYTPGDFCSICSEVAGVDLADWVANAVDSTNELDYQELADWFGLQVGDLLPAGAAVEEKKENKGKETRWIGVGEANSPASKAGLSTGDELIAVNGVRLDNNLDSRLQDFEVGDPIEVLIARDDEIMEVLLTVAAKPAMPVWNLKIFRKATEEQAAHLHAWLRDESEESMTNNNTPGNDLPGEGGDNVTPEGGEKAAPDAEAESGDGDTPDGSGRMAAGR
jgi:predicted metalloprotease with PDZ domain